MLWLPRFSRRHFSRCGTDVKTPRRICLSVSIAKKCSTRLAHDALVGVKYRNTRLAWLNGLEPGANNAVSASGSGSAPASRQASSSRARAASQPRSWASAKRATVSRQAARSPLASSSASKARRYASGGNNYGMLPTRNNRGESHENGSVEGPDSAPSRGVGLDVVHQAGNAWLPNVRCIRWLPDVANPG